MHNYKQYPEPAMLFGQFLIKPVPKFFSAERIDFYKYILHENSNRRSFDIVLSSSTNRFLASYILHRSGSYFIVIAPPPSARIKPPAFDQPNAPTNRLSMHNYTE